MALIGRPAISAFPNPQLIPGGPSLSSFAQYPAAWGNKGKFGLGLPPLPTGFLAGIFTILAFPCGCRKRCHVKNTKHSAKPEKTSITP
jgi:hypothetical protein